MTESIKKVLDEAELRILRFGEKKDVIRKQEMRYVGAGCRQMDRIPFTLKDDVVDGQRKFLHTKNEEVGRQWVTLSEAMSRLEGGNLLPFQRMVKVDEVTQCMMSLMVASGNPKS